MVQPRDTQKQRVYAADGGWPGHSAAATKHLINGPKVDGTGSVTIEACQAYVDHVTSSAWFQSRWGRRRITVKHKVYGTATGYYGRMCLPPWSRTEATILHELAHALTVDQGYASHGPEFAGVLLTLVRYQVGTEAATAYRAALREARARYNLTAVPSPGTRTVVTRTSLAKAAREQASAPLSMAEVTRAADYITRAVKAGQLGAVGTQTRDSALATARALRKVYL